MVEPDVPAARRLVRLVVASPDRSRVLARPNGLAGWRLPVVAVEGARATSDTWTDDDLARAAAMVGGPVEPVSPVGDDVWEFGTTDRVGAAGTTWIAVADADRFGADAEVVRFWAPPLSPDA